MNKSSEIYQSRINRVIDYVNGHLEKTFSLDELASIAHFSSFHFHRIFVAVTGESVNFFTNRVRLEKTARLLKFSSHSISEVAMECGFSSPSTFSRAFKQYFGISPSAYREGEKIENSKICKELFPLNEYLVPMNEEELTTNFPVEVREFTERRVAYIRVSDSFQEGVVINTYKKLIKWAKTVNVFDSGQIFGMSLDDPMVTPQDKYRYEACITLPEDFKIDPNHPMETMILPSCNYAVTSVSGDFKRMATATHYLFNHWLINSPYEPTHQPGLEIFKNKEKVCDWSHFDLNLCIPIKPITIY